MRKYEIMMIVNPDTEERQMQPIIDKYTKAITSEGGTVDNVDIWGRRHLAYPIQKKMDGLYAVINVTSKPESVQEMNRLMSIDEQIMRTKVMRIEA